VTNFCRRSLWSIPDGLLSLIIGYEKGSLPELSSACRIVGISRRRNCFFDEIKEMSTSLQGSFAVMQKGEVRRWQSDVRMYREGGAANKTLDEEVSLGRFVWICYKILLVRLRVPP